MRARQLIPKAGRSGIFFCTSDHSGKRKALIEPLSLRTASTSLGGVRSTTRAAPVAWRTSFSSRGSCTGSQPRSFQKSSPPISTA
jgi:hypothetical protein